MTSPARSRRPAPLRRARAGWLAALALVVFYCAMLGSIHGVAHAAARHVASPGSIAAASADAAATPGWTDRLFGHRAGERGCGLFDEIISDVGLLPPAIPLPELPQRPPLVAAAASAVFYPVGQSAFEARAPPARH